MKSVSHSAHAAFKKKKKLFIFVSLDVCGTNTFTISKLELLKLSGVLISYVYTDEIIPQTFRLLMTQSNVLYVILIKNGQQNEFSFLPFSVFGAVHSLRL